MPHSIPAPRIHRSSLSVPSSHSTRHGLRSVNASKAVLAATGGTLPPADTPPPTATITSPTSASTVSGTVSLAVAASDNVGVTRVEWYLNGTLAGTSTTLPATFSWSTI